MKKFAKQWKVIAAVLLMAVLVLSLASCGSSAASAEDASGTHGTLTWSYTKENRTLTVTGSGEMANFETADAVVWKGVRSSVEKVVVSEGITSVGNYAFYMMFSLKEVSLPSTLTAIGDYGFGYASSLASVTVPQGVASVGKGAFGGCRSLGSLFLPGATTTIGERAFAYCYSMQTAMITGVPQTVGAEAFKNCTSLERLTVRTDSKAAFAENAFEGAKIGLDQAVETNNEDGSSVITVHYVDKDGNTVAEDQVITVPYGETYTCNSPTVDGYTAEKLTVRGTADGTDYTETVTYRKNEVAETPENEGEGEEEKEDEPVGAGTIIAIVIMVVVLIGIGVGAFLLVRSDKKTAGKNTTTVRKNQDDKKKRK